MSCNCRNLPRGTADVFSLTNSQFVNTQLSEAVVVRNLGTGPIETCSCCGHRVDPLGYMLCKRNDMVTSAIAAGHLQLLDEFSAGGHILTKE